MNNMRIDWRWIAVIAALVVLAGGAQVPWIVRALVLLAGGGYLLWYGWGQWTRSGGPPSRSNVTYWRGQRIEVGPPRRGPALPRWQDIGPAALYLVFGVLLVLAGLALTLDRVGF